MHYSVAGLRLPSLTFFLLCYFTLLYLKVSENFWVCVLNLEKNVKQIRQPIYLFPTFKDESSFHLMYVMLNEGIIFFVDLG
jgi:hypothetical protein